MIRKLLILAMSFLSLATISPSVWSEININTAEQAELETLKGIGPEKAKAIIDYRTQNGQFDTIDDLTKVKGIGKKTLESLRNDIKVEAKNANPQSLDEVSKKE